MTRDAGRLGRDAVGRRTPDTGRHGAAGRQGTARSAHRAWAAAGLLALVLLAGCIGGGDDDGPTTTTTTTRSTSTTTTTGPPTPARVDLLLDFSFVDCLAYVVIELFDLAAAQALLPEGYTALEYVDPTTGVATGKATANTEFYACTGFTSPGTVINDTFLGRVVMDIEDPGRVEADMHLYQLRVFSREDVFANVWPVAGYDTISAPGNVSIPSSLVPGAPRQAFASLGAYNATGAVAAGEDITATFAAYTAVDGAELVWTGSLATSDPLFGSGTFTAPTDDPLAPLRDGTQAAVHAVYGSASLTDMDLWRDPA